jgi:vancomycin resistance protein YoaR
MPEDVFSMDSTLGPRTASNGYYPAHVIMQNKLVDGLGGGLCQVASTLYNSVLLADLQIVERMHHTWPLAYVKHGLDATISEGAIDLKFRNDLDYPILIVANASQGKINIRIMGKKPQNENKIRIRSEILETYYPKKEKVIIDNSVPDGQKIVEVQARKGYKIAVYKETLSPASVVLEKERVSLDIYNPITGVVRVNKNYYN